MITPLHLEILIHAYTRPSPMPNCDAPAVIEYAQDLFDWHMIKFYDRDQEIFESTSRGKVWLRAMLSVPMPIQQWRIPDDQNTRSF